MKKEDGRDNDMKTETESASPRLEVLLNSLEKKEQEQSRRFDAHFADVSRANGQPLNDKRNGRATLTRWGKKDVSLRNHAESIEKTKAAIEREKGKIQHVNSVDLPAAITQALDAGEITQWRKNPRMFFVVGVDRGRICWDVKTQTLGHRYLSDVLKDQYPQFRDTFNKIRKGLQSCP